MNRTFAAIATAAVLAMTSSAFAEEATGKIAAVDPEARMIELEDGTSFTVEEGVSMEGLAPGAEVTVSYEESDGKNLATDLQMAQ